MNIFSHHHSNEVANFFNTIVSKLIRCGIQQNEFTVYQTCVDVIATSNSLSCLHELMIRSFDVTLIKDKIGNYILIKLHARNDNLIGDFKEVTSHIYKLTYNCTIESEEIFHFHV